MPRLTWKAVRDYYAACFTALRETQKHVASVGGLGQSSVQKLLKNERYEPSVETFIRALYGIGMTPAQFFALLEARPRHPDAERALRDRLHQAVDDATDRDLQTLVRLVLRLATHDLQAPGAAGHPPDDDSAAADDLRTDRPHRR